MLHVNNISIKLEKEKRKGDPVLTPDDTLFTYKPQLSKKQLGPASKAIKKANTAERNLDGQMPITGLTSFTRISSVSLSPPVCLPNDIGALPHSCV